MPDPDRETLDAAVFDFVSEFLEDEAGGGVRPLHEYLARYPSAEAEVAAEYLRLTGRSEEVAPPRDAAEDDGARRVGHYVLERELGHGGQGAVWLAFDERLQRRVALKLLGTLFVTDERRARFRREAESIARLDHPGLAGVHDADLDSDLPWIAMRYVEGVDLGTTMAEAREAADGPRVEPPLPWRPSTRADVHRVLRFFERAARALHAAHEEGVVHRDIKPGNLMVTPEGEPVLLDFGLARDLSEEGAETLTREGEVFGTPAYMAPEQLSGRPDDVDRRADVWSLGVTLYEALTGTRPFDGRSQPALARAVLEAPVPDPRTRNPALSSDVKVVLETALERDRSRRYESALALAEDLRRITAFEPVRARRASPWLKARRWCRREPAWAAALGVTLVSLVLGLVLSQAALRRMERLLDDKETALAGEQARRLVDEVPVFLEDSPSTALAVALEAVRLRDAWWTRSSLFGPLEELTLHARAAMPRQRVWEAHFVDGGARLVVGSAGGGLGLFDVATGDAVAERVVDDAATRREEWGRDHPPGVRRLAPLAGGDGALVGTEDGVLRRVALPGLEDVWVRSVSASSVLAIELVPRTERAVVLTADAGALVVDVRDGSDVLRVPVPRESAGRARVSPDGSSLLTASRPYGRPVTTDSTARLWRLDDGALLAELEHGAPVRAATFDAAGGRIATAAADGRAHLWDGRTGAALGEPLAHPGPLEAVAFSPDGARLAVGGDGGAGAWLWDLGARERTSLPGHGAKVVDVSFDATGARLATSSWDNVVREWDVASGALRQAHRAGYRPFEARWSPGGDLLCTVGVVRYAYVWRTRAAPEGLRLRDHGGAVVAAGFRHDGQRVVTADERGDVRLFSTPSGRDGDARAGALVARLGTHAGGGVRLAVAREAPYAVGAGADGSIARYDLARGERDARAALGAGACRDLAVDPSGTTAASVWSDGRVAFWRPGRAEADRVRWLAGGDARATRVVLSADGRLVAVGDSDGVVRVYDAAGGALRAELVADDRPSPERPHAVVDLAFLPGGDELVVAVADRYLEFWDVARAEQSRPRVARLVHRWIRPLPDGDRVVVCGEGRGSIRVDGSDGSVRPATLHDASHTDVACDPTGRFVATASEDGTALVWRSAGGGTVARFDRHRGAVTCVAFAPVEGDARVLTGGVDGTAAVWQIDPLPAAERLAPHGMDRETTVSLGL